MSAIGRALMRRPTTAGMAVATVFWWFSLVPSLLPRTWMTQAAISAICVGIGYAIGTAFGWLVRRIREDTGRPPLSWSLPWIPFAVGAGLLLIVGCIFWVRWQNQQRELVDMDSLAAVSVIPMLLLTVVLTFVLGMIGRLIGGAVRRLDRWNRRHLPGVLALPTTIILVVLVAGLVFRDVIVDTFVDWADRTYSLVDNGTDAGTEQPTVSTVSGSPDSLVAWDDLGRQGRNFVAQSTSQQHLQEFATEIGEDPDDVVAPVRAYAGIKSSENVAERAQLAVEDLKRAGGFDREVLVVATATGTGWIDPDAARGVELMHGGDTAIVSMQYSFLPSWIAFLTDLDRASNAGAELFDAVYTEWIALPEDDRPLLISFGISLGSFGAAGAFTGQEAGTSIANMVARSDGALFVGTPYHTELLRQLVGERDPDSPAWAPQIGDGRTVRFETRDPNQPEPSGPWDEPRVLFFQHPSDPVVHWYYNWFWSTPEWMDEPRGYDVPARAGWFPIVTGVQGVFDLMAGFSAPPGHGHDYAPDYPVAWSGVVPPAGWTDEDTEALEAFTQALRDADVDD